MITLQSIPRNILSVVLALCLLVLPSQSIHAAEVVNPSSTTSTNSAAPSQTSDHTTLPKTDAATTGTDNTNNAGSQPPQTPQPAPSSTTGAATNTGPSQPNGDAADTYTFNESTGLWENDYYSWNPETKNTSPKSDQSYSYNPETDHWDTVDWRYNAATQNYEPNVASQSTDGSDIPDPNEYYKNGESSPSGPTQNSYNGFYNGAISNAFQTLAYTGNASLAGNTIAGNATSGSAYANSTVINLLQSLGILGDGETSTFALDIPNHTGDILIDPAVLGSLAVAAAGIHSPLTVNTKEYGVITNDLAVAATSGDAEIADNTKAGSATSGNADAVANIVNAIGTSIGAGRSFIGNLNILGELNGDILLPKGMVETLITSNSSSNGALPSNLDQSGILHTLDQQGISNNINSAATTGDATIAGNTSARDAITGDAKSNVTVLNLTGNDIVGANNLLVFVNILGKWVGMIVNAPDATAASLGGGITKNDILPIDIAANSSTNNQISNNLDIRSQSGDATITGNTSAGDAITGDATTSVNLANFINSRISLSEWFGILFINVFGSWDGSFGIDTAAGNRTAEDPPVSNTESSPNPNTNTVVYRFVPSINNGVTANYTIEPVNTDTNPAPEQTAVLASSSHTKTPQASSAFSQSPRASQGFNILYPAAGLLVAVLLLGSEHLLNIRRRAR